MSPSHRAVTRPGIWRIVLIVVGLLLLATAGAIHFSSKAPHGHEQIEVDSLPTTQQSVSPSLAGETVQVSPEQPAAPEPLPSDTSATQESADTPPVMPLTKFAWPAAGMDVTVVPMDDWQPDQKINPPVDANGHDPVGHWLRGTGEVYPPIVISAHTCYVGGPDCNDRAFPFLRLSYDGWKVGQVATITDAAGRQVDYTLTDRQVVDKSKRIVFEDNRCLLYAFTCNIINPDAEATLVTFQRTGCEA